MSAPRKKFYLIVSYVLLIVGLLSLIYGLSLLWQRYAPAKFSELDTISKVNGGAGGYWELFPVQLYIAEQDIKVPLLKGSVMDGEWKLSEDAALAIQTGTASRSGTVVYGHNYPRILGALENVTVGERFELVMSDWSKRQFEVVAVKEVMPEEVQVLVMASETDLIVYTCSGFLDTKRLVVRARLVDQATAT